MISKAKLKKYIQLSKEKMNELVNEGDFRRNSVAECLYCCLNKKGEVVHIKENNTACHAGVGSSHSKGLYGEGRCKGMSKTICMINNICDARNKYGSQKARVKFMQYLMDHEIFGKAFLEHDAKQALDEHMMVIDLSALPSNVTMFVLILGRALWEDFQRNIVDNFFNLVEDGFNEDDAMVLSFFVKKLNDKWVYSPTASTGHNAICTNTSTIGYIQNFHNHVVASPSPGSIVDGYGTGGPGYNVFTAFRDLKRSAKNADQWEVDEPEYKVSGDKLLSGWIKDNIDNLLKATNKLTGGKS